MCRCGAWYLRTKKQSTGRYACAFVAHGIGKQKQQSKGRCACAFVVRGMGKQTSSLRACVCLPRGVWHRKTKKRLRECAYVVVGVVEFHRIAWVRRTQCNRMQCSAMQCNAVQCNALQRNAMQCKAMQCIALQCNVVQCR